MVFSARATTMPKLLLASSSPYRRQLLDKLGLDYQWRAPDIDETALPDEPPQDLVIRLATRKAKALASDFPDHLIIGSDQVAVLNGKILGKPGNIGKARKQLMAASGNSVTFLTGLCLFNSRTFHTQQSCEEYSVTFRELSEQQIEKYLQKDQPFNCAGSFKAEGLGISLFKKLQGDDPNTLIGLPLIALIDMLNEEGIDVPD
jgi:MAF protein